MQNFCIIPASSCAFRPILEHFGNSYASKTSIRRVRPCFVHNFGTNAGLHVSSSCHGVSTRDIKLESLIDSPMPLSLLGEQWIPSKFSLREPLARGIQLWVIGETCYYKLNMNANLEECHCHHHHPQTTQSSQSAVNGNKGIGIPGMKWNLKQLVHTSSSMFHCFH